MVRNVPGIHVLIIVCLACTACREPVPTGGNLKAERQAYETRLNRKERSGDPVIPPPSDLFELVHFDSAVGKLPAYLSRPDDTDGSYPAMIWLVGGFGNGIDDIAWSDLPESDDQSASIFWKSGIVTLYPSLRGGNQNPGYIENCFGEVDDVIAAAEFLKTVKYVDPDRIYLGGHSTGGTLALLVAESTDLFRAVFAFGPTDSTCAYGQDVLNFDASDPKECALRAPIQWLDNIHSPTFVFEGTEYSNIRAVQALREENTNDQISFYIADGYDHFSVLYPVSALIAVKILRDEGPSVSISFGDAVAMGLLQSNHR